MCQKPPKISFFYEDEEQNLESVMEEGTCVVHFNDKWYRTRDDFFQKAVLDGNKLTAICDDFYGFEVEMEDGDH